LLRACLLVSTLEGKMLGSVKGIGSGMLSSTTGLRSARRNFVPTQTFLTLLSVSLGSLILLLRSLIHGKILALGFRRMRMKAKKETMVVVSTMMMRRRTTTTPRSSLFGSCCKRGG
jgi:hypothetical protein